MSINHDDYYYYKCVEVVDMAKHLGIDLWGCSPLGGYLRVAPTGSYQPTGIMTRAQIIGLFNERFEVVPLRAGSQVLKIREKERLTEARSVETQEGCTLPGIAAVRDLPTRTG